MKTNRKILVIAGLDPSGNAGLLRDLQVMSRFPLTPYAVVTALTAQTRRRFFKANVVSPSVFSGQLKAVSPIGQFSAVKIGMLGNEKMVQTLIRFLKSRKNRPPIVLDPVCDSTTGGVLLTSKGRKLLYEKLVPLVSLWTPNLAEASHFSGIKIDSKTRMINAAQKLWSKRKVPALIKGLKHEGRVYDLLFDGKNPRWFSNSLIPGRHRGLGCALSSLISSNLAMGKKLSIAVKVSRLQNSIKQNSSF
ncbi:MAG: hydroxymethylpyrimidine/phosphomethylpyrimidine kinase [Deltaproteobacteria bacterium]|nr:hydroxymethylpyrimidine/phosphomethylpyrimidine kinase [Deltaproteobacteria bacterium]